MWPKTQEPTFTPDNQTSDRLKPLRDREYRDKRLMLAAQLSSAHLRISANTALVWADELIRANEEMKVPE